MPCASRTDPRCTTNVCTSNSDYWKESLRIIQGSGRGSRDGYKGIVSKLLVASDGWTSMNSSGAIKNAFIGEISGISEDCRNGLSTSLLAYFASQWILNSDTSYRLSYHPILHSRCFRSWSWLWAIFLLSPTLMTYEPFSEAWVTRPYFNPLP